MSEIATQLWNNALIQKYDLSGPRYTSYPTAMQFHDSIGQADWIETVKESNQIGRPLSLYLHIPYCDTVCYYCACNRIITANKKAAVPYIDALKQEIRFQASVIDTTRPVKQMHWGGGTPTYISEDDMAAIMAETRELFKFMPDSDGEYSIEIHPSSVDRNRIFHLRELGFNRLSMGIQDFNPEVQTAVNRFNSVAEVERLMKAASEARFHSVSMDLIYGLPKQTAESFANTINNVIDLNPDRISLFNYAHLPARFKTQRQINTRELPEPQEKLIILHQSIDQLINAGYVYIGMDHFAKPDDELAIAQTEGSLQRNFQGYSTYRDCDLFSFGTSAISSINNNFFQNYKTVPAYTEAVTSGELPLEKGFELNQDDIVRREVIMQLICNFELNFSSIEQQYDIDFKHYFSDAIQSLETMTEDGLITLTEGHLTVQKPGRLLIRRICMCFDRYNELDININKTPYSRII